MPNEQDFNHISARVVFKILGPKLSSTKSPIFDANTVWNKNQTCLFLSEQPIVRVDLRAAPLACFSWWMIGLGHPLVYWQATNNSLTMKWKCEKKRNKRWTKQQHWQTRIRNTQINDSSHYEWHRLCLSLTVDCTEPNKVTSWTG